MERTEFVTSILVGSISGLLHDIQARPQPLRIFLIFQGDGVVATLGIAESIQHGALGADRARLGLLDGRLAGRRLGSREVGGFCGAQERRDGELTRQRYLASDDGCAYTPRAEHFGRCDDVAAM